MYSNAAAGVPTYNPADAASAAQMHSMPPANQPQYYSLPGPQQMSVAPPGAPVTTQMPAGYGTGSIHCQTAARCIIGVVARGQGSSAPPPVNFSLSEIFFQKY